VFRACTHNSIENFTEHGSMSTALFESGKNLFTVKPMHLVDISNTFQSLNSSVTVVTVIWAGQLKNGASILGTSKNNPHSFYSLPNTIQYVSAAL
jgi:hypothetical protein